MESVVYAVDWNQVRENVLSGAAWLGGSAGGAEVIEQLRKPTALVCSTKGAERNPLPGGRKKRDDMLVDMIRATVAKGGTVLIPTDTSARVLELAYLLEHAWRKEASNNFTDTPLKNAKLYLASRNVGATMRYARSMLEWMDENVVREFETEASGITNKQHKRTDSKQVSNREKQDRLNQQSGPPSTPFDFKYLKLLERKSQIDKITSTKAPRVILASDSSLEWGFSREILQRIATDPSSLIILTEEYGDYNGKRGLGSTLWAWYQERADGVAMEPGSDGQNLELVHTGGKDLRFEDAERVSLEGKELAIYQQYLATQRRLQDTLQAASGANLDTAADALDETSSTNSSSSEESDPERQGKALNTSAAVAHFNRNKLGLNKETLGVNVLLRQSGVYDYDVRGKKGREQMFPFVSKRRRGDDLGEVIRPEDYLRAEERDEIDGQDMRGSAPGKQAGLGQKRKWEDSGLQNGVGARGSNGPNKRRQQGLTDNSDLPTNIANGNVNVNGNGHRGDDDDEMSEDSDTEPEELVIGPSKVTYKSNLVQANLRIAYIDFAGLHDQRSLSMLIPLIQPRKLILVGGTTSETTYLADDSQQKLSLRSGDGTEGSANTVFTPSIGETINASVDTNAWTVKLSEALVKRLNWQNVKDLGVVTLMGLLTPTTVNDQAQEDAVSKKRQKLLKQDSEGSNSVEVPPASEQTQEAAPLLDVLPASMAAATRSVAQPLHVGDLRLADLRKLLQTGGHTAEFRGEGTLLIDGLVAVRKSGTGKIEVESGGIQMPDYRTRKMEGPFYAVKRKIYEGLAIIAGG